MKFFFTFLFLLFIGCSDSHKLAIKKHVDINESIKIDDYDIKLIKRFMEYWELRSTYNFEKSFLYELPYIQYTKSLEDYISEGKTRYRNFDISLINILVKNEYTVEITRKFKYKKIELKFKSIWIKVNGTWYRKYDLIISP